MRVLGKDLRAGDCFDNNTTVLSIGARRMVPAKVLHASVARRHPEGLPARTAWIAANGARIGMTVFDDDRFWVKSRVGASEHASPDHQRVSAQTPRSTQ